VEYVGSNFGIKLLMDGGRLLMNSAMARNTRGSGTARRDNIDQGLWILA